MIDLDLDDPLDLAEDDVLDLGLPTPPRAQPLLPTRAVMEQRCREFAVTVREGRAAEVFYAGTCPDLALWTYVDCFTYWHGKYVKGKGKNALFLELAFMSAAKNLAGGSWGKVHCTLLGRDLRAEVVDCTDTAVRLALDLPYDTHTVKGNVEWLPRWRAVWFNRKTRKPLNPVEPFRLL